MSNPTSCLTDPICINPRNSLDYAKSHTASGASSDREAPTTHAMLLFQLSRNGETDFYRLLQERVSAADRRLPSSSSAQPGRWTPSFVSASLFDLVLPVTVKPTNNPTTITSSSSCSSLPRSRRCQTAARAPASPRSKGLYREGQWGEKKKSLLRTAQQYAVLHVKIRKIRRQF